MTVSVAVKHKVRVRQLEHDDAGPHCKYKKFRVEAWEEASLWWQFVPSIEVWRITISNPDWSFDGRLFHEILSEYKSRDVVVKICCCGSDPSGQSPDFMDKEEDINNFMEGLGK